MISEFECFLLPLCCKTSSDPHLGWSLNTRDCRQVYVSTMHQISLIFAKVNLNATYMNEKLLRRAK